jgi:hypothetical protein
MQTAFGSQIWRRKRIQTIYIRPIIVAALCCILIGDLSAADTITINVRQPDPAIRQQLLQLTLLGTSIEEVHSFLENRLARAKGTHVAGWPVRVSGAFMVVDLGHYYEARNLFIFPTVVQAFWHFDQENKLRDIRVRRFLSGL